MIVCLYPMATPPARPTHQAKKRKVVKTQRRVVGGGLMAVLQQLYDDELRAIELG